LPLRPPPESRCQEKQFTTDALLGNLVSGVNPHDCSPYCFGDFRDDRVTVGGEAGTAKAASRSQRFGYPIIRSTKIRRPAVPTPERAEYAAEQIQGSPSRLFPRIHARVNRRQKRAKTGGNELRALRPK